MDDNKVAVLLEDLISKFRVFGEGLEGLHEEMNRRFEKIDKRFDEVDRRFDGVEKRFEQNRQEHQQLIQMVKELDNEVQVEIKRVK